jgi:hypothetical protein
MRDEDISSATAGGVPDGPTLFDCISRYDNVYTTSELPNKVFINVPVATATKDMLH